MGTTNLHNIFCYLTGDPNFLSTIVETKDIPQKKKIKKNKCSLMTDMVTEYVNLSPYETQGYSLFPAKVKPFLNPDYMRYGIINSIDKDLKPVNVSFLVSLNILLRPDIYKSNISDHNKNLSLLESFIRHKIGCNSYQIDKIKNTKKMKLMNKELCDNLADGKITSTIIQCIINIFEINLLVFDFRKNEIYFYWAKGHKYPYVNLFKNIYCMSVLDNGYEPIMAPNNSITREQQWKIYATILNNINDIKSSPDIVFGLPSLIAINVWNISYESYMNIIEKYFIKTNIDVYKNYNELLEYEKQ